MDFKGFYKELIFDVDENINSLYTAKQGDTKSRGFYVTVTQNRVAIAITNETMTFYAEKPDGTRVYQHAVKDDDGFRIDLTNQVFATAGLVKCELTLLGSAGEKISSKTFKLVVDTQMAENSIVSKDERGIIDDALDFAINYIPRFELIDVELLENYQSAISSIKQDLTQHKEEYTTQRQQDQLKVATVEKELNDYKGTMASVNVNQEAKQKVSGYGIVSLPKTAANGQVSVSVKGRTYTNILGTHATKDNILNLASGGNISLKGVGGIAGVGSNKLIKLIAGNRYLVKIDFLTSTTNNLNMLRAYSGTVIPSDTQLGTLITSGLSSYVFFIAPGTDTVSLAFRNNVADSSYYHDKSIVVDLTSIGETETDINKLIQKYSYVSNTKSTISASRIKSAGKNLFDEKKLYSIAGLAKGNFTDGRVVLNNSTMLGTRSNATSRVKLVKGQYYTIKTHNIVVTSGTLIPPSIYQIGTIIIVQSVTVGIPFVFTGETGTYDVGVLTGFGSLQNISLNIQLEEGTVVTPYAPYTESTSYLPNVGELRSLSNGAKDEIRVSGGVAEKVKRIEDYALQSNDLTSIITANTNVERISTSVSFLSTANKQGWTNSKVTGSLKVEGLLEKPYADSLDNINTFYTNVDGSITFLFAKGTTLEQARTLLSGLKLTYQLAEPIITPIQVSGTLLSNSSGTVYVENVVADAGIYTTKFNIKDTQLPVKSIDKLIKYNFETGVQAVLNTSLAVINADKKSFTHPNLTDKDMVFLDYYYDIESTLGETTIEYYDSRHTIKDSVNNKFYKWDIKSANGVPTVVLTEVL